MPDIRKLAEEIREKEKKIAPPFVKGIRPDLLARAGSIDGAKQSITKSNSKMEAKKSEAKVEPNLSQSEAKVEPNLDTKKPKVEPQPEPHHEPKLSQSEAKVKPNLGISVLVGLQRKILFYFYEMCRFLGGKTSPPINVKNLAESVGTTTSAARKAIQRLEDKGFIDRVNYKDGRGGWSQYRLHDETYIALFHDETRAKVEPKLSQTRAKVEPQPEPQPEPKVSSSSSIYVLEDFKTTTTDETEKVGNDSSKLEKDWLEIDSTSLAEIHFGQSQLFQIAQLGKLAPGIVQDSIDAFAFDLKKNNKAKELKTAPLNFFMGILRRGMPYSPPENYESPQDEAQRKYLESKRAQAARRQAMQQEIFELEFQEWKNLLTSDQRKELAPHARIDGSEMQIATLREYFLNRVQFQQQNEIQAIRKQIDESLGIQNSGEHKNANDLS